MALVEKRHLLLLRKEEIEIVRSSFKPGTCILEIGGGNGYQASIIASWGCEVQSVDLPEEAVGKQQYFPVQRYDGQNIPCPDECFDVVFSSNVLEHVEQIDCLLAEVRRVLRPDGTAVHILPSPSWRAWTSLAHYFAIVRHLIGGRSISDEQADKTSVQQALQARGLGDVIKRAFLAGPHGVYPSAFSELYYFSKAHWNALFQKNKFDLVESTTNGLFYTGYGLFPNLSLKTRRRLAVFLGSACNIFVLKKSSL